uniref:Putative secreted peptide n=1 Tax=Anopheles braziliensis TaxID=58242 RepID=A0A2M3ZXA0_9DIPT
MAKRENRARSPVPACVSTLRPVQAAGVPTDIRSLPIRVLPFAFSTVCSIRPRRATMRRTSSAGTSSIASI